MNEGRDAAVAPMLRWGITRAPAFTLMASERGCSSTVEQKLPKEHATRLKRLKLLAATFSAPQ
jgi:hypothetical protein